MKSRGRKGVVILVIAVVVAGWWMARRRGPERRIAARMQEVCDLAEANVKTPVRGVDALGAMLAARAPELMHDLAELTVDTTRIGDERRHDERAREARRVMAAPLHACSDALSRFAEAVEHDEVAHAHLQRALDRLARTLQLLFGDAAASELRGLVGPFAAQR